MAETNDPNPPYRFEESDSIGAALTLVNQDGAKIAWQMDDGWHAIIDGLGYVSFADRINNLKPEQLGCLCEALHAAAGDIFEGQQ